MKNRINSLLAVFTAVFALSSNAYAGCNDAQHAGTWDITFSDGNSCRLVLDAQGEVIVDESICFDPFRGTTVPNAGAWAVGSDCSFGASIVVEGVSVDLEGQLARGRDSGAGRFVVPAFWVKGSYTMIRVP